MYSIDTKEESKDSCEDKSKETTKPTAAGIINIVNNASFIVNDADYNEEHDINHTASSMANEENDILDGELNNQIEMEKDNKSEDSGETDNNSKKSRLDNSSVFANNPVADYKQGKNIEIGVSCKIHYFCKVKHNMYANNLNLYWTIRCVCPSCQQHFSNNNYKPVVAMQVLKLCLPRDTVVKVDEYGFACTLTNAWKMLDALGAL